MPFIDLSASPLITSQFKRMHDHLAFGIAGMALLLLDAHKKTQGLIAVGATLVYILGFAVGQGAVSW
jgi:hypothetical protein